MLLNGPGGAGAIFWHVEEFVVLTDGKPEVTGEERGDLLVLDSDWEDIPRHSFDIVVRLQAKHLKLFQRRVFSNS